MHHGSIARRAACGAAVLLAATAAWAGSERDPFVFVSLPDTQVYAEDRLPDGRLPAVTDPRGTGAIFYDQTEWIVENARRLGIRYVGHLGDIVQDGNDLDEWALAHDAMHRLLEADIPHGTVMGNHDDNHGPDYRRNYLEFFGPRNFDDRPWFTASSPGGGANLVVLEHRHRKIGFLNFSIDHPQAELDWATDVVQSNPDTLFVVGTHRYLFDFKIAGGRYSETLATPFGVIELEGGPVPGVVDPNTAQEFFDEFVSRHPNILMIHAGHFHAEWLRLDEQNAAGQTLIQILTDYQSTRNGGDGWLRLYALDFDAGTFRFDTYSPTLDRMRTTIDHFVETIYLAYAERDEIKDALGLTDDAEYFFLLEVALKDTAAPDGFLLQHPDLDEPEEQAYYQQYLEDLFLGSPPDGFDDILEWENLWIQGFAADRGDIFDFRDGVRSPSFTLDVDFADYFTPSPTQLVAFAFEDLLDALTALEEGELLFPGARRALRAHVESALRLWERGHRRGAERALERKVLPRTDGCAARGEPDPLAFPFWLRRGRAFDWIDDCAAQAEVYPLVTQTLERLDALPPPEHRRRARRGP